MLIVDDEAPARLRLSDLLHDLAMELPVRIAGEASNGREALDAVCALRPDVVLLDIRMPEIDGIETAEHLLELEHPPAVIFTTAYDDYAVRAFEVNAIDYLLKPVRAERLAAALNKAQGLSRPRLEAIKHAAGHPRSHLAITDRGRIVLVPIHEVIYLKAELKYVTVRTAAKEYLIEESLSRLEQEFGERFVRIHRNCLVARAHVAGFKRVKEGEGEGEHAGSGWVVMLKGIPETPPVSRRQQHVIREFKSGQRATH
ncbi:LytR/AlgR family response regulator transcription factor [Thiobacter aerophilum]|uniref:LytTR family DNA-binding domain-containing protein n=1 Tax=Thiobacter aerophilum TaxID=3121275 RepID=A0ABV0EF30_9BURK